MRILPTLLLVALIAAPNHTFAQQAEPPAAAEQPPAPPPITDPLVKALLETKPSTPAEMVQAIETLINLKHDAVAKQYVNQLLAANLDRDQMAALARQFGTPTFLRLSTRESLQPEGRQLADAVLGAYAEQARDPARLAELIERLKSSSADTRHLAMAELRRGGPIAVAALIGVLADPHRAEEHAMARTALVTLGSEATQPLTAVLSSDNDALRIQAIDVLRRLRYREAAPYLVLPAFGPNSSPELQSAAQAALADLLGRSVDLQAAAGLLYTQARTAYEASTVADPRGVQQREVWRWDADTQSPLAETIPVVAAELRTATRLSKNLAALMPDSPRVRRLYLSALLESAAIRAGLDQPLSKEEGTPYAVAAAAGPAAIEQVLAETMTENHLAAATAAAAMLGEIGSAELLDNRAPQRAVLVNAAYHPDRRLRYTAMNAIMQLGPTKPYPGASQVLADLAYFAGTGGTPKALVVDSRVQEASRLAGLLAGMGYDAEIATDGRAARERLASLPDFELVLVDLHLIRANIDEWLQQLRRDHRTASLPVGVLTPLEDQIVAQRIIEGDPLAAIFARPQDAAGMEFQVKGLLASHPHWVPLAERQQQAANSLAWLAALAAQPQSFYSLRSVAPAVERALFVPELTLAAAPLVADLGTASGQRALVAIASRGTAPVEARQAVAAAFAQGVARYGILLTNDEILAQYDRYNLSEAEPAESQQVLSSILDTLESRLPKQAAAPTNVEPAAPPASPRPAEN
jgi:CheY-like chemotaxis protein